MINELRPATMEIHDATFDQRQVPTPELMENNENPLTDAISPQQNQSSLC